MSTTSDTNDSQQQKEKQVKNKAPAFQFYPRDFLCDGKVLAMPMHCRGAYITLLCIDWIDDGILKTDFATIAGVAEIEQLQRCFVDHPIKKGYVTNPRLLKERQNQKDRSAQAQDAAAKRWHSNGNAGEMQTVCTASASTSASTSTKKNNKSALSSVDFNFPSELDTPRIRALLDDYIQHRREKKSPVTKTQIEKLLKKYAFKPDEFIQNAERSIENGWLGIFAPEEKQQQSGPSVDPRINTILKSLKGSEAA